MKPLEFQDFCGKFKLTLLYTRISSSFFVQVVGHNKTWLIWNGNEFSYYPRSKITQIRQESWCLLCSDSTRNFFWRGIQEGKMGRQKYENSLFLPFFLLTDGLVPHAPPPLGADAALMHYSVLAVRCSIELAKGCNKWILSTKLVINSFWSMISGLPFDLVQEICVSLYWQRVNKTFWYEISCHFLCLLVKCQVLK